MSLKVLVIDDEKTILQTFKLRLNQWGHEVFLAADGNSGMRILSALDCHVVITDMNMPGLSGHDVVQYVRKTYPDTEVVVITGYASVESAVEVMKAGACDFLVKPLDFDQVRIVLDKIEERISLKEETRELRDRLGELKSEIGRRYKLDNLVGKSKKMQKVFDLIEKVAPLDATVVIFGETGTGKEMVARAIHHNSSRSSEPMVPVDCGTLTETLLEAELFGYEKGAFTGAIATKRGRFEQAHGGTIFLDEVENASPSVQKKLLRVIQEKVFQRIGGENPIKVDVRIIAAADQDLFELVKKGKFRQDLFYRLNVVPIHLAPLRERKCDVPLLARYFLDTYTQRMGREPMEISPGAMKELVAHSWPGNVRELSNVIERSVIMTPGTVIQRFIIHNDRQPDEITKDVSQVNINITLKEQVAILERKYLNLALEKYHGRLGQVARHTGLTPRTLYRKMKLYMLDKKDFR